MRIAMTDVQVLTKQFQKDPNDTEARDALVLAYTPLVKKIARRYARHPGDRDDLRQAGMIGLLKALPKYDPTRCTLGAYARKAVLGAVQDAAFEMYAYAVTVPERQRGDADLHALNGRTCRLDDPVGYDKDGRPRSLRDVLADKILPPDVEAERSEYYDRQYAASLAREERRLAVLKTLPPRDQKIVLSRYRWTRLAITLGHVDRGTETLTERTTFFDKDGNYQVVTRPWPPPRRPFRTLTERVAQARRENPGATEREIAKVVAEDPALVPRLRGIPGPVGTVISATYTWPLPSTVAGIAKKLGLSRQAIYDVLNNFEAKVREA
jgi:RNA polymerase sigma factor (sigma-70 family)